MFEVLGLYLCLSMILLFGAAELERRAIVARRLGPNGRAMLVALAVSAAGGLVVTFASVLAEGWIYMLHVLGGAILYHGLMGAFLVHGLQEVSARAAGHDPA